MTAAVTFGLPSRSPPIQVPNVSGAASAGRVDPVLGQLGGQIRGELRDGVVDEGLQVVQRVAGLVDRCRTELAELVGLPDQVDQLGEFPVLPGSGAGTRRRPDGQDVRQAAAWSAPTGGSPRSGAR